MLEKEKKFPLFFGRKGGGKLKLLNKIKSLNLEILLKEIIKEKVVLEKEKLSMVDVIHAAIGKEKNETIKKMLLNYKRDLFNSRNIEKYNLKINNKELKKGLTLFSKFTQNHKEKVENFKFLFDKELLKSIENLKEITEAHFFKNGILFSSQILYNQINKTDFKFSSLNKKNKKLASSVLKYLTRSITKTTPYSSFNNIFCLKFDQKNCFINQMQKDYSSFQVINLFFYYLKLFLLEKKEFKNTLEVYANSTISINKETNKINYFSNQENNESFKNIENNQILGFILNYLATRPQAKYEELILKLQDITEEPEENVINYIQTLIEEGFIILKYPVSSTNPNWIYDLKKELSQITFSNLELKENLLILLDYIVDSGKKIEITIKIENRKTLLNEIHETLMSFFKEYSPSSEFIHKVKEKDLFYEDTISSLKSKIPINSINKLSNELVSLQNIFTNLLNHKKELKIFLTSFLVEEEKNVLEFYEHVYLKNIEYFSFQQKSMILFNEMILDSVNSINSLSNIEEIDVSIFCKQGLFKNENNFCFGVYFQSKNDNLDRVVINNFSNGRGSNISRFLTSFPLEYAEEVREYNKDSKIIITEVKDASIHNTNTFPPLCESLISINEDLVLKDTHNLISLKKIFVSKNELDELILINEKGNEIEPQIFSLEGINRRSKFTQFLDIFNKTDHLGFSLYLKTLNNYYKKLDKKISVVPRLIFKKQIIIQRKKWFVKKKHLQEVLNKTTLAENFLSINEWIIKNKIPSEIFIKITERDIENNQNDNYKPQFLDFSSPIFMLLIINLIEKAEETIELTEMYPNVSHVDENDGYVKEFVININ